MNHLRYTLLVLLLLLGQFVLAQITFQRSVLTLSQAQGHCAVQTPDSGYVWVGRYIYTGVTYAGFMQKTDRYGNTMWRRRYTAVNGFNAKFIESTSDGGYALYGESLSGSLYRANIIKIDANGSMQWNRYFSAGAKLFLSHGRQTSDGGYIVAASYLSTLAGSKPNAFLIKTDSVGATEWTKGYGNDTWIGRVLEEPSGGYLFGGTTATFGAGISDIYLVRTDSGGDTLWTKTFGTADLENGKALIKTIDGGYLIAGYTDSLVTGRDLLLVKLDNNANLEWAKAYGGSGIDEAADIIQLPDSNYVLVGHTTSGDTTGQYHGLLVEFNYTGDILWSRTFGDEDAQKFYSVRQSFDGGYIIAGYGPYSEGLFIKTDANGYTYCGGDSINFVTTNMFLSVGSGGSNSQIGYVIFSGSGATQWNSGPGNTIICMTNFPVDLTSTDNICKYDSVGTVTLSNVGGIPPLSFAWSNGDSTQNISGLTAGFYDVTITDSTGLTSILTVTILEPDSAIESGITTIGTPCGLCTGQATVNPTIGTPPYTYLWSNGDTSQSSSGLCAESMAIIISDSLNCQITASVIITELNPLELITASIPDSINSGIGQAIVNVTGGLQPYTYLWSDSTMQTLDTAVSLLPGFYQVTVIDSNGCIDSIGVLVQNLSGPISFVKTYGGWNWDVGKTVIAVDDGFLIAGETNEFGVGYYDVFLMKTDLYGNQLWYKTYGGSDEDRLFDAVVTSDGGFALLGMTRNFGQVGSCGSSTCGDFYLIRTDDNGDTLWTRAIGASNHDQGLRLQQTTDQGFALLGNIGNDIDLIKTDLNGYSVWSKEYEPTGSAAPEALVQTPNGGYLLAGTAWLSGYQYGIHLIKTWPTGDTAWTGFYGGLNNDRAEDIFATSDGNYLILGLTEGFNAVGSDLYLFKVDPAGDVIWSKTYGGSGDEVGIRVIEAQNGDYVILGTSDGFDCNSTNISCPYLVRVNSDGNLLWSNIYDLSENTFPWSLDQASDLGFVIAGQTLSWGAGAYDAILIKTDSNGQAPCVQSSVISNQDTAMTLVVNDMTSVSTSVVTTSTATQIVDTNTVNCGSCYELVYTVQNVACHGESTGSIDLAVQGAVPPYTFSWSNGMTTEDIVDIEAGTYQIEVKDSKGCITEVTIEVTESANLLGFSSEVFNDPSGTNDGAVLVSNYGGMAPYVYLWSTGDSTSSIYNLAVGQYSLEVTDFAGCIVNVDFNVSSSNPIKFQKIIGGDTMDIAESIEQTFEGGYIIAGRTQSYGMGSEDIFLVKTDDQGVVTWSKTHGTADKEFAKSVRQTADSGYVVYGSHYNTGWPADLIKTNSTGDTMWTRSFANGTMEVGIEALQTFDLGYITAAQCYVGAWTTCLTKTDANGDTLWVRRLSYGTGSAKVQSIIETYDGSYLISVDLGTGFEFTKLDVNGMVLWSKRYDADGAINSSCVVETADSGFVSVGSTSGFVTIPGIYMLKTDSTGEVQWSKSIGGTTGDNGYYIREDSYGDYVLTGYAANYGAIQQDVLTIKTNKEGTILWAKRYGGVEKDIAFSLSATNDGGYIMAGETQSFSPGQRKMYIIKTDVNGNSGGCYEYDVMPASFYIETTAIDNTVTLYPGVSVFQSASTATNPVGQDSVLCFSCISVLLVPIQPSCNGKSDGSVILTSTGGDSPYTYNWNTGATTQNLSAIGAGNYSVTVTDASGCTALQNISNEQPPQVPYSLSSTDITCFGDDDGTSNLSINSSLNVSYVWSTGDTSSSLNTLQAGTYSVTVTDSASCQIIDSVVVDEPLKLSLLLTVTNITCHGVCDGSFSAVASGGISLQTVMWTPWINPAISLCPDTFEIEAIDANGCLANDTISIMDPDTFYNTSVIDTATYPNADGGIDISVFGGMPPYSYIWSDGSTTEDLNNVPAGIYAVDITDGFGCLIQDTLTVPEVTSIIPNERIKQLDVNIYPNPNNGTFNIYIRTSNKSDLLINIYDVLGKCVRTESVSVFSGMHIHPISLSDISPGIYEVEISSTFEEFKQQIIIE